MVAKEGEEKERFRVSIEILIRFVVTATISILDFY